MGENYVLELKDIVKLFPGVRALDGMSLHASPGKSMLSAVRMALGNPP